MSCENESEEIREFTQNMLQTWKRHCLLMCGSSFEMPIQYVLTSMSDMDVMYIPLNVCAMPVNNTATPNQVEGKVLTTESDASHPGFARLFDANHSPVKHSKGGPAATAIIDAGFESNSIWDQLLNTKDKSMLLEVDRVFAISCPCWPAEADEWIMRERKYGWPSNDVVARIVTRGCHLVAKSPYSNRPDCGLWRFSFSLAETILVHTWTDVQKYVYHLLKLIKNEVLKHFPGEGKTILSTYFLKTLMFWVCEENGPEFWEKQRLADSVSCLVCRLIEWLIDRSCPNYFIQNNNMMGGLPDDSNLSKVTKLLLKYRADDCVAQLMSKHEMACSKRLLKIAIPNKILFCLHTSQMREFFMIPFTTDMRERLMNSVTRKDSIFWSKWCSLYKAIKIHLRLMHLLNGKRERPNQSEIDRNDLGSQSGSHVDAESDIRLAVNYFMEPFILESSERESSERVVCLGHSYHELITDFCKQMTTELKSGVDHKSNEIKNDKRHQQSCEIEDDPESSDKDRRRMCCYRRQDEESQIAIEEQSSTTTLPFSFTTLPTLLKYLARTAFRPCLVVNFAYLANFCHTALSEFNREMASFVFEDVLQKLSDATGNKRRPGRPFSIAITNELSPLFDKHFQTVL